MPLLLNARQNWCILNPDISDRELIILTDRCNETDSLEKNAVKLNRDLTQRLTTHGDRRNKH